ncbi:MAG TPA: tol-pal system protein YbgF [Thermodesulfobacteriota bacterium]|nr:tol-pal system protein YbgF [Thermodesulfobacteriota bacterium]
MRSIRIIKAGILLALAVFLWGCATTQDVRILDREINRLQSQVNTLQKEKETRNREFATLRSEWKSELNADIKKLQADLLFRIEKTESEIRILNTGLDEYKDFAKRPSKDVERIREDVILRTRVLEERGKILEEKNRSQDDRTKALEEKIRAVDERLKGMEGKIDLVTSKQVEAEKTMVLMKEKEKEVTPEAKGPSTGMSEVYNDAYQAYQKGEMEGARRKFEAFLKQYPNTSFSDNAQFWIGETYYAKKDYEKAILEYEKVMVKYPEGDKVPAALLKQGLAFLELGDKANARNLLRRVMDRYPQSEQAEIAKKRLETIK